MHIRFLGTGSTSPSASRRNTSIVLSVESALLLIDCSGSPAHDLMHAGCNLAELGDVFLTHEHVDHVYALPSLIHTLWQSPDPRHHSGIRIIGNPATLKVAMSVTNAFALEQKHEPIPIRWVEQSPGIVHWSGASSCTVEAFPVSHANIPTLGLKMTASDGTGVLYTSDATIDTELARRVRDGIDVLVQDCGGGLQGNRGHAGALEINSMIAGCQARLVILTHLPPLPDEDSVKLIEIAQRNFKGKVVISNDGDVFPISWNDLRVY